MNRWKKVLAGCGGLIIFDQLTKLWVLHFLKGNEPFTIIPGVLELLYVENRGAAFGMMQNKQWLFLIIGFVVLAAMILFIPKIPQNKKYKPLCLCLYFVGAGAVGNMIDRIVRGYVVDFIYVRLIDFPVFNVADIYVTTASFLLLLLVIFRYKEEDFNQMFGKKS